MRAVGPLGSAVPPRGLPGATRSVLRDPAEELAGKAVDDPYAAVRVDAALARHALPPGRFVSGLVYDVTTGLIQIVDPVTKE